MGPKADVNVLYTNSETVGVKTVATFVADKATLGIKSPSSVEVTSNAPTGETVPIPTWALQLLFPKRENRKVKKKILKSSSSYYLFLLITLF